MMNFKPSLCTNCLQFVVRAKLLPSPTILKQATINGAKNVGMEGLLGELIPGAYADLLFLNENPLEDITCFRRPEKNLMAIIKDGRVVQSRVPGLSVERSVDWS
jgi:imidazolonepropionase-like amidohydrolase